MVRMKKLSITVVCIVLAIVIFLWGQSAGISDTVLYAVLIGIGVITPTIANAILFTED